MVGTTHQSRTKVFSEEALAFDDVLLVPSYSDILPINVNLSSFLTKSLELKTPIYSETAQYGHMGCNFKWR